MEEHGLHQPQARD